jgi:hypothetical protein
MSSTLYIKEETVSYEKRIAKVYVRELGASFAIYTLLLVGCVYAAKSMPEGPLRTALAVSPVLGFGLAIWAMGRQIARMDEYMRMRILENIAVAAAITAGVTFTYGFLEGVGFPRMSGFTVWAVMAGSLAFVQLSRRLINK